MFAKQFFLLSIFFFSLICVAQAASWTPNDEFPSSQANDTWYLLICFILTNRHFYWDDTTFYFGLNRTLQPTEYAYVFFDTDPHVNAFEGAGTSRYPMTTTGGISRMLPFNADYYLYSSSTGITIFTFDSLQPSEKQKIF
jgi:hypothetical protein